MSNDFAEKTRLCPSCRCTIPILATKCRFCGEEVGKPKEEARLLTTADLGGETIYHRAPSGSVMEAMEAFRAEETQAKLEESQRRSTIQRKNSSILRRNKQETPPPKRSDLPDLDEHSRAMADAASDSRPFATTGTVAKYQPTAQERMLQIGAIAVGVLLVVGLLIFGIGYINRYLDAKDTPQVVQVVNRAPALLEKGQLRPAIDAAAAALVQSDAPEHRAVADQVIARVSEEVNSLLNVAPWRMEDLRTAAGLAEALATKLQTPETKTLHDQTQSELNAYSMELLGVAGNSVRIALLGQAGSPTMTIEDKPDEVETFQNGRFQLEDVRANSIRVRDTQRMARDGQPRTIIFEMGARPRDPRYRE
ncbi:MAG: hypothetical protein WD873_06990 [Candidatus Hydrogenedentales bacterium]